MVIHKVKVFDTERFGARVHVTTTLCGRSNAKSSDGTNAGDDHEVTCKFCLKMMAAQKRRSA